MQTPTVIKALPLGIPRLRLGLRAHGAAWRTHATRLAPFAVMAALLVVGYLWHAAGTAHADDYQAFSFRALNYSDIIALYVRDGVARHPRPYLDFPFEYPPLTGALTYLLGRAPGLRLYYGLTYTLLSACAFGTALALGKLPGVKVWRFAAAPAVVLYAGLNWDLAAICATALALLAFSRRRDGWGTLALLAAVWLKLFPVVFLAAILLERMRERRWRAAATIAGLFALGSTALNAPLAWLNWSNWSFFFTFNNARRPEPSLWTLLPPLSVARVNALSLLALVTGASILCVLAWRARQPVTLPLGAGLLLWWLLVNKIYSPQYALWIFLALALLGTGRLLWQSFAAFDIAYYVASFQILYFSLLNVPDLVNWQARYLLRPLVIVRVLLLLACVAASAYALWRLRREQAAPGSAQASPS